MKCLPTFTQFLKHWAKFIFLAIILIIGSLLIGTIGYHVYGKLSWLESALNASMILTGMGPVDTMTTDSAKIFAILYAIYSAVAFLGFIGVFFYPVFKRVIHHFHLEVYGDQIDTINQIDSSERVR